MNITQKDATMKKVQGYEFEQDYKFGDDATYILACLRRQSCVYVQFDDGPMFDDLKKLEQAGLDYGYWSTHWDAYQVWFIDDEEFEVKL
jgi:hypothetical protein